MKRIALTQHKGVIHYALVDDKDFDRVNQYRWHLKIGVGTNYAYRKAESKGKRMHVSMHRFILGLSAADRTEVDHINFNGLDNCRAKLRLATRQENNRHRKNQRGCTHSQYKGVYWEVDRSMWRAYLYINKKKIWLGRFIDEVSAARAYNEKSREMYGEYALFNVIN